MILKILVNYILGYVNIKVEGFFVERFINICRSKKITIWNLKRDKLTILYANVGIKDYKRLKEVSKKTGVKIKIQKKNRNTFLVKQIQEKKGIFNFVIDDSNKLIYYV